jgi:hypothetical protein
MTLSAYTPAPGELNSAYTTTLYALDIGTLMIILAYFMHELTIERKRLIPKELIREYRVRMYATFIAGAIFLISTLPVFWNIIIVSSPVIPLRYLLWSAVFVARLGRRFDLKLEKRGSDPG